MKHTTTIEGRGHARTISGKAQLHRELGALTALGRYDEIDELDQRRAKTRIDLVQMFDPVSADLEAVEREFERQVQSQGRRHSRNRPLHSEQWRKRVRPAVLLMAARLCGYTGPRAILNAAVVEFIHTATLVHDDIIDDADVRRGQKAVHSRWGNDVTVLAGDFLYIKSMAMALTQDSLDLVRLLCDVTLRMIEGELYQLTKNGVVDLSEEEHFDIIRRKTAYLFAGCAADWRACWVKPAKKKELRCASTDSTSA